MGFLMPVSEKTIKWPEDTPTVMAHQLCCLCFPFTEKNHRVFVEHYKKIDSRICIGKQWNH